MHTFKRQVKLHTSHRKVKVSPEGDILALWTPGADSIHLLSSLKEVAEEVNFKHKITYLSWCLKGTKLILTSRKHVFLYDIFKRRTRTLVFVENIHRCYKSRSKLLFVQESRVLVVNMANVVKSKFYYDLFKLDGSFFILTFENCVTVFDENLNIVYDHLLNFKEKIIDVCVRNRKVYFLTQFCVFGHDLSLRLNSPAKGFLLLNNFLVLAETSGLRVYDKNLEEKLLEVVGKEIEFCSLSQRIYVLEKGSLFCYSEDLERRLRFRMIEKNEVYDEKEDEFDISDDLHRDF